MKNSLGRRVSIVLLTCLTINMFYGFSFSANTSFNPLSPFAPLPSPWVNADIGSVGAGGTASYNSGAFSVSGSGSDIWGSADSFHFSYRALNGDGEIQARVTSLQNTHAWAKAGVMIRESLSAGSKHAAMLLTPVNGVGFFYRRNTSGSSRTYSAGSASAPYWVKLARKGSTITCYRSADGVTWAKLRDQSVPMTSSVLIGLAVTSHNNQVLNTSVFDNVGINGNTSTLSALGLSPSSVTGGASCQGTVTLTSPAPSSGAVVMLASSNTSAATVPTSVTVSGGATSATFSVSTSAVSQSTTANISGSCNGASRTSILTVNPPSRTLSSLSLNPTSVTGGNPSTGTVTLSGAAPSGGAVVTLSSSNTSVATVPASVTVAAGATSATFTVSSRVVTATSSAAITGSHGGVSRLATLTVNPASPAVTLQSLTLSPTSVTGGSSSQGTVTLSNAAPSGGAVVALSSSNTSVATVPASITVVAGSTSRTFTVTTVSVASTTSVTISGAYGGTSRGTSLSVQSVNPPGAGPAVAYGFNEGSGTQVNDASGNGNHGSVLGATWTSQGKYGNALSFDGTNDKVMGPNFTLGVPFTFMAWVNNPGNAAYETIVMVGSSRDLYLGNGAISFHDGSADRSFGSPVSSTGWHHVALTYDGTNLRAYLDGVQAGAAQSGSYGTVTDILQVGAWGSYDFFGGLIDEVRIYNRALTQAEIQTNMSTPIGGVTPPHTDTTPPVISSVSSSSLTSSGATITWTTNEPGDTQVEYGTTSGYGSSSPLNTSMVTSHSVILSGLSANTTYNYRVKSRDAAGNLAVSSNFTFTTPAGSGTTGCPGFVIEGFGRNTIGGCGGRTIFVTNLNDSGPGSLRDAVNQTGARIVRFAVSGWITLASQLDIDNSYITIDGSDAPNGGIGIRGSYVEIGAAHVIIRNVRFRHGLGGNNDCISINGGQNVVIDHCSFSWSTDENFNITGYSRDITVQWCIISEGFDSQYGMLINGYSTNISVHHNLFAHNGDRNPAVSANGLIEVVNNVMYNGDLWCTLTNQWSSSPMTRLDFIKNYGKWGPNSGATGNFVSSGDSAYHPAQLYVEGNINWRRTNDTQAQDLVINTNPSCPPGVGCWRVSTRRVTPTQITETSALQAYTDVLNNAGATLPCRDAVDLRVVNEVTNGTGRRVSDPTQVGGYPDLTQPCGSTSALWITPNPANHQGVRIGVISDSDASLSRGLLKKQAMSADISPTRERLHLRLDNWRPHLNKYSVQEKAR